MIREEDVVVAVAIDIDEAQAGVAALGVDDARAGWESVVEFAPAIRLPLADGGVVGGTEDEFADSVVIEVTQYNDLLKNKKETGRPRDIDDIDNLK